jgi:hypothetical protein
MRMFLATIVLLALAVPLTAAQSYQLIRPDSQAVQRIEPAGPGREQPAGNTVRSQDLADRPPMATVDETTLLKNRVMSLRKSVVALQSRVATLEEQLRAMTARTSFVCRDVGTSANGAGGTESCAPYACNYLDGRCRASCATSDHCAPGYLCDTSVQHCVPPPPADDADDSWWPF